MEQSENESATDNEINIVESWFDGENSDNDDRTKFEYFDERSEDEFSSSCSDRSSCSDFSGDSDEDDDDKEDKDHAAVCQNSTSENVGRMLRFGILQKSLWRPLAILISNLNCLMATTTVVPCSIHLKEPSLL